MVRSKQTSATVRVVSCPPLSLTYLYRISMDVQKARVKFKGNIEGTRLKIAKFSPAGKIRFLRKNNQPDVTHTEVYLQIPSEYPFEKPKLFFMDTDILLPGSIAQSGQYMDKIVWSPGMNISDYIECVRYEIFFAY